MTVVRRCKSLNLKRSCDVMEAGEDLGLGFVGCTRAFGRKRIAVLGSPKGANVDLSPRTPVKLPWTLVKDSDKSLLESLPQELLVRVLCGVDHEDLEQLVHVSKTIRDAALIAKKWHFAYSTPTKSKTRGFAEEIDVDDPELGGILNAPMQMKYANYQRKVNGANLASLAVRLFEV